MQLRDYQQDAINSVLNYLTSKNEGNPVVSLPTGTGKAAVIGGFIQQAHHWFPNMRTLMLTHVQELVEQNANTLRRLWSTAPLGICSAGLGRSAYNPRFFGGDRWSA